MFSKSHPVRISLIALLACGVFLFGAGAASGQTDDPYVGIPTTTTVPGFTTNTTTVPGPTTTTTTAPGPTTTTTSTTVPDIDVLPDTEVPDGNVPGGPAVLGETVTRPASGLLPFTGGELALLVLIGVGLFAGGAVVILGSKRRQTSD